MRVLVALAPSVALAARWPMDTAGNSLEGVPATFDCGMRKLAYTFGKQLLPRQGSFESLFLALGLNEDCPTEMSGEAPAEPAPAALPTDSLFVDPTRGADANPGTESSPLKTVAAGVAKAARGGTVVLRAGRHQIKEAVEIGAEKSGLTVRAYPGEKPEVSGGVELKAEWAPYKVVEPKWEEYTGLNVVYGGTADNKTIRDLGKQTDAAHCQQQCEADKQCTGYTWHDGNQGAYANFCWGRLDGQWPARQQAGHTSGRLGPGANIYKANIKGQVDDVPGLQLDGARATRARYPNLPGGIEVSPGYDGMIPGGSGVWTPPQFNKYPTVQYFTDNVTEHNRNNTPDNWFQHYMIGTAGLCTVYDPPVSYWCSENPSGGGAFAFRTPSGVAPKDGALPNSPYADVSQLMFNVWRPARWANWMFEVDQYNQTSNNFTFGKGGNQGARGSNSGGDFFVENVFEELDSPGEFFFNRSTGDLYLFYNGTGAPPSSLDVVVPQAKVLFNVSGTQWNPVSNVTFDGLTFRATRYTYMDPHGVPSGGDWALDRIGAVFLQGTEGTTIQNGMFERLDGNAVMISGYNRNTTVQDSDFAYIGGNAVASWGYTNETENTGFPYYTPNTNFPQAGVDGTDGNHPRYNAILRNSAREVGLYEKQSSFYVQGKTAESLISGNVFFNGPRAGINANDGFGGGDVISHNLVFSTCRESGDHGPFNSWDRQPFLTTVRTGEPSMLMAWREIHHNFFIDNYSPQEDVDNDDGSAYYRTHDNFLVYGGQGMKNDFGGHDNHHYNNTYAFVGQAMGVTKTLVGHEDFFTGNSVVMLGTNVGGVECSGATTKLANNRYFTSDATLTECGKPLSQAQEMGFDTNSTVAAIPQDDVILRWAETLLGIVVGRSVVFV
mmetsp:Transcript_11963/g.27288  ORF Transcript_11963/g.27288 Transcript_11963/m.27288 type:complete len:891 (+) Transcript_11963:48-2720(+)|eukprot:CAMPEP_0204322486 /NCGR_PEP_ID=MMETSP0469-20131031/8710_1 /ASSEMBLY_ACC=CAM_ASM_000384 /TAXON_ID=2969 /ORGANISM="Oxyrrhis marina" /LENGTH=890 /DNA_ID=CAMNT_0051303827 /DNA_START=17 /DNA_END=2689 /DNA_ORIENTATION=-